MFKEKKANRCLFYLNKLKCSPTIKDVAIDTLLNSIHLDGRASTVHGKDLLLFTNILKLI